ncbi:glycoside hydrolase family 13 protein [Clostridium tertium]|uniref:glycoside hydrolase family 13 protein n=1 Tax=Clostridium tertium TaxID=1559 RepID=UPI001AE86104|nr:alpha-glucosidase [Clostridium tertium]MBP1867487.1 oligo-1,6-glucosidase/glucan 1,6-alpha-glucosidase [Clostridium tertium]
MEKRWWHDSVVYQVYPRSFMDSNNDGIGDINGIISKLDYLKELGIDVIWLSPVYKSPNVDNGYDISDYCDIMDEFGTMEDMKNLIKEAELRGIKIIMDLVVNHTSDEHMWFKEARKSKENPYRDFFVWRDAVDGRVPNELKSNFGGSAWTLEETTGQYYLHLHDKRQPDLNWENETLRKEIYKMMNFWLELGIKGFRMDVIDLIGKEPDKLITQNGPKLHYYIQEMYRETFGKYDVLTVGETWGATPEIAKLYSDPNRNELSMVFQFEVISLDKKQGKRKWDLAPLDFIAFKDTFRKWQVELHDKGWNSLFGNNHDLPRMVSRWGNDKEYRVESAKMLATMLHMQKGTPYVYQGEEIGMTNVKFPSINDYNDIEGLNMYKERIALGYSEKEVMESLYAKGRDNARTPMQWDGSKNAGFTTAKPWIGINENYKYINVEKDMNREDSIFEYYKKLIKLRKKEDIIKYGAFELLLKDHKEAFVYTRSYNDEKLLVACNFYGNDITIDLGEEFESRDAYVLISNYNENDVLNSQIKLRPYEAVVYKYV